MKYKKILALILTLVGSFVLIMGLTTSIVKVKEGSNNTQENNQEVLKTALKNFVSANYIAEIGYSVEDPKLPDVKQKSLMYKYKGDIEEYYTENFSYEYDDYKEMIAYKKINEKYYIEKIDYILNHDMLVNLIKKMTFEEMDFPYYKMKISNQATKKFLDDFSKKDNTIVSFKENETYYALISIDDNKISWISIMEERENSIVITYSFKKMNQIQNIKIPKEFVKTETSINNLKP